MSGQSFSGVAIDNKVLKSVLYWRSQYSAPSYIQIYKTNATTTATIMSSMRIALSMYTALLTAAFGVDKKMLPENPLKHEMKLLKFEHNKLKNTQVDDKTYYNIIHLKT